MKSFLIKAQFIYMILYIIIYPLLILFISGDWFWIEGWIFSIWFIGVFSLCIIYLYHKDPELLAERFKRPGSANQEGWDKYFLYVLLILWLVWFVIMPLDKRFGWTASLPIFSQANKFIIIPQLYFCLKILGGIGLLISSFFLYRSFTDNTFLSPLVRIQTERKHRVISTGVYSFVRHPMYLGSILWFIGTPLLFGSCYGFLISVILAFLLTVRIIGEEKMLVKGLEGYADYKKKVKYRLIPFIW